MVYNIEEPSLCNHSGPNTLKPHLYLGVSEWIGPHTDLTNPTDFLGSTSQQVNKWIGLTQISQIPRNFFKKSRTGLTGLTGLKENTNFNENENLFICETPEIPETLETPGFWSKSEANILIFGPKAKYKRLRRGECLVVSGYSGARGACGV